ncbi:unnamed protein product [Linum tenue]|uniref:Uncharacterized protein n=1 Tax=Linum tenue TaxID=586396 RepID=A0AAV0MGC1_9ROSI|nr:unnamed protein product [Linum tenue]
MTSNYTFWCHHGEKLGESLGSWNEATDKSNNMFDMLRDLYPNVDLDDNGTAMDMEDTYNERSNDEADKFYRLLIDSEQPLYDGCKSSKLTTLLKLLHIKAQGKWSNESFTMLLKMMKEELLPEASNLPDSYYETKKINKDLGLSYVKIDACQNSCMLFRKDDANLDTCKVGVGDILNDVPEFLSKEDWEWLVKEKFLCKEFKEEKLGRPPTVAELVFETYKEGDMIKDDEANERHAKILEIMEANSDFTALEVVEAILGE